MQKTQRYRSKSIALFSARPLSSAVLAVVLLVMGLVFIIGVVPLSPNRTYFPGHGWLMAGACWALAVFFGYCAAKGRHQKSQEGRK